MPRRLNSNELVCNNTRCPKGTQRQANARTTAFSDADLESARRTWDRLGMVLTAIFGSVFLLMVFFLVSYFQTNQQLKEMTNLLNFTRHQNLVNENIRLGSPVRPIRNRIDHAQFILGAKVIKLQAVELPMNGPSNEIVRQILGMTVPNTACNILGRGVDRKNFLVIKGDKAIITIRLNQPVFADTIRIDHHNGDERDVQLRKAMPKDIAAYGIHMKTGLPVPLGQMRLAGNHHSKQSSGVLHIKPTESFELFKIEILSNHGNPDFTRLYKVKIYGEVDEENRI